MPAHNASIDDVFSSLQLEDFSVLPAVEPPTLNAAAAAVVPTRFKDMRTKLRQSTAAMRPVLQRQKAMLGIDDLDSRNDGKPRGIARVFHRAASAGDHPLHQPLPIRAPQLLLPQCRMTTEAPRGEDSSSATQTRSTSATRRHTSWPY